MTYYNTNNPPAKAVTQKPGVLQHALNDKNYHLGTVIVQ
jgi:hypothetical protein